MVRLLIVDDSAFSRHSIARLVGSDPGIEVVGFAKDGVEALAQMHALSPTLLPWMWRCRA